MYGEFSVNKEIKFFGFGKNVLSRDLLVSLWMYVLDDISLVPLFLSNVIGANKSIICLIERIAESTASLLKTLSYDLTTSTAASA